jgi:hypothetical protein
MREKTYKATSLTGAQTQVRRLRRQRRELVKLVELYNFQRQQLAKLAADGPCFDNPLIVWEAKRIRDRILKDMGLRADGKFLT